MTARQVCLGDVADLLVGFAFKSAQFLQPSELGINLVRGDNVQQGYLRWGDKAMKWSSDDYDDLARYQLQLNDVVLAMDRPIVGGGLKLAWVKESDLPCLLVQRVTRIRGLSGVADTNYLRFALSAPDFTAHIDRITTGANIPHISGKDIAAFSFRLPPLEDQLVIVEKLAAYDDLIENNRRRIALLEESARLLYREWFVDLRFPEHESLTVTNGLPDGWARKSLAELTSLLSRGITPTYNDAARGLVLNQKCIRGGLLSLKPGRHQSKEVKADRLLQLGDVLINSTGAGTLGRVALVRTAIPDCTVDTHITIARPATTELRTFFALALLELEPVFTSMGKGSTNQLELGRSEVGAMQLVVPPVALQVAFQELVWPLLSQSETLGQIIGRLTEARDALLPKLMSGEIAV